MSFREVERDRLLDTWLEFAVLCLELRSLGVATEAEREKNLKDLPEKLVGGPVADPSLGDSPLDFKLWLELG